MRAYGFFFVIIPTFVSCTTPGPSPQAHAQTAQPQEKAVTTPEGMSLIAKDAHALEVIHEVCNGKYEVMGERQRDEPRTQAEIGVAVPTQDLGRSHVYLQYRCVGRP